MRYLCKVTSSTGGQSLVDCALLMASPLLHFLTKARSILLSRPDSAPSSPLTLVLGNPSCDLDSFISATVYSFFHSQFSRTSRSPCLHIPILNLPTTSSSELWRLRPEFVTALRLALDGQEKSHHEGAEKLNKRLLENLITISDIWSTPSSPLHYVFSRHPSPTNTTEKVPAVLIDHNALSIPIPDLPASEVSSNLDIMGCIDHHIDESSVPVNAFPRIITTGIGSCTSLVVQFLKKEGYWQDLTNPPQQSALTRDPTAATELAKLSLASILIDTANLTAEGKVSDTDRKVVNFLEDIINASTTKSSTSSSQGTPQAPWDRNAFYHQIATSKANSLDLLTLPEIFERDYKSWSENITSSGMELKFGVASVVKPITWLIEKSAGASTEEFMNAMIEFAKSQQLDLFAIMTAFSTTSTESGKDEFMRELLIFWMGMGEGKEEVVRRVVDRFEKTAHEEIRLDEWRQAETLVGLLGTGDKRGRIWEQRDVSKSRKQVAPLLREAMRSV